MSDDIPRDVIERTRVSNVFGTKRYWKDGMVHRDDGPAVEYANGDLGFFQKGVCHRIGGPAFISVSEGRQEWWHEGKLHRANGPAIVWDNGHQEWYFGGKKHRTDGPAITKTNGLKEFWIHGKQTTEDKMADQKMGDPKQDSNSINDKHPFTKAYKKAKEAREFNWKRPLQERYNAYMEAAEANRDAARHCGGNHQLYSKFNNEADDLEKDADALKKNFKTYFSSLGRKKSIVVFTKRELAKELTQAALRGYFGVNSFYDVSHGLGKKAVDNVYAKLDELMSKLNIDEPLSPDVKELEDKNQSKSSDIQTIQDPTIAATTAAAAQDLPEKTPVQDLNAKPFAEENVDHIVGTRF